MYNKSVPHRIFIINTEPTLADPTLLIAYYEVVKDDWGSTIDYLQHTNFTELRKLLDKLEEEAVARAEQAKLSQVRYDALRAEGKTEKEAHEIMIREYEKAISETNR